MGVTSSFMGRVKGKYSLSITGFILIGLRSELDPAPTGYALGTSGISVTGSS